MAKSNVTDDQLLDALQAYHAAGDNQSAAARALGVPRTTFQHYLDLAKTRGFVQERAGRLEPMETQPWTQPKKGQVKRYLCTSAQDGTKVHADWWKNILAIASHYDAEILVSTFHYNKDATGQNARSKGRQVKAELPDIMQFDPAIQQYISNERRDLAPRLTWCGELNIIPTARRPLSGMESYTYRKSTIVPHTTIQMKSVAGMKEEGVKLLYTTGACTQINYIKRKEGFRAEHFHAFAALLVEVTHDGRWFVRQIEQGRDGTACDLSLVFKGGKLVRKNERVANICWGDVHGSKADDESYEANWGEGGMLDTLRPYSQHIHDLLDCGPFGHHTIKDHFESYRAYMRNDRRSIATELRTTANVATRFQRAWCRSVVVNSNHDRHLTGALRDTDWRKDPENAETLLYLTAKVLRAIRVDDREFNLLETALKEFSPIPLDDIEFLPEDKSDVILRNIDGGIECGLHGDRGANGAKGTPNGMTKLARKINMADKHTAEIIDHVYVAGVSGNLDMGYNKGASSWTHANIVTYNNGCRAIVSVYRGKWRA